MPDRPTDCLQKTHEYTKKYWPNLSSSETSKHWDTFRRAVFSWNLPTGGVEIPDQTFEQFKSFKIF